MVDQNSDHMYDCFGFYSIIKHTNSEMRVPGTKNVMGIAGFICGNGEVDKKKMFVES